MRILILHSDVPSGAAPDDQDTLLQAAAVETILSSHGHEVSRAAFIPDLEAVKALAAASGAECVFNLVETAWGRGAYAAFGAQVLSDSAIPFTGGRAATIAATSDKLLAKRILTAANLPTALWSEAPHWYGLTEGQRWIVKSADEDASLGLDDHSVVCSVAAVKTRAVERTARYGGRWFAEAFVDGREFNVGLLERDGEPFVLPIGEMIFEHWPADRPRIIGYAAKWHESTPEYHNTTRIFRWSDKKPGLRKELEHLAKECWALFGCRGYARVDFRLDAGHRPFILEVNANPCLEPDAGYAAAAAEAGISYGDLVEYIVRAAI